MILLIIISTDLLGKSVLPIPEIPGSIEGEVLIPRGGIMRNIARVPLNLKLCLKPANFDGLCVRRPAIEEGITRLAGVIDLDLWEEV